MPAAPSSIVVELSATQQALLLRPLRRARYGHLRPPRILPPLAAGHPPGLVATVLFCCRPSVHRTVARRAGRHA